MSNRTNVIDLNARRNQSAKTPDADKFEVRHKADIVDMTERRQAALQDERRSVRRTILTEFIGVYCVVPGHGLKKVSLYDISENGLSFDMDFEMGSLRVGEEIAMRIYLSQFTYFPFVATVTNVREVPEEGIVRHGGTFLKGTVNDKALFHFVKFVENVSLDLKRDMGDLQKNIR